MSIGEPIPGKWELLSYFLYAGVYSLSADHLLLQVNSTRVPCGFRSCFAFDEFWCPQTNRIVVLLPKLIKPRCDNHTEPPYPYSLGTSAGAPTGASGNPIGPAGTGNPTLSSNSAGALIGSSGSLPSSSVRGLTSSSVPVAPLTTGSNPSSTNSASAPFPVSSNNTLNGTILASGASGSPTYYNYKWNSLASSLTGTGIVPTGASGSISALQTGASGGTVTGSLSIGASSATGLAPFGNLTSSGLTGTSGVPNPTNSDASGLINSIPSGTGIGPLITGPSPSISSIQSGNSTLSGFAGTGVGLTTISGGVSGGSASPISGSGIGLLSTGVNTATGSVLFGNLTSNGPIGTGTRSISTGIEVVTTGIATATEFPPFPTFTSGIGVGATGQTLIISPTNSSSVPTSTSTETVVATFHVDPSFSRSTTITLPVSLGSVIPTSQANLTSGGVGTSIPPYPFSSYSPSVILVTGANPSGSGVLPSLSLGGTGGLLISASSSLSIESVPPATTTGGSQSTGNTGALVPPITLNLTIATLPSTTTSGGPLGTGNTLVLVSPPTLSRTTSTIYTSTSGGIVQSTGVIVGTGGIVGTGSIVATGGIGNTAVLVPSSTLSSTSTSASYISTPGGIIQGTGNSVLQVLSPTLNITTVPLPPTTSSNGLPQGTGTPTASTPPINPSLTPSVVSFNTPPIIGTGNTVVIIPSPSLSLTIPSLPSIAISGGLTQGTGTGVGIAIGIGTVTTPVLSAKISSGLIEGTGTVATPVTSSITSGGLSEGIDITATLVPPPTLSLNPGISLTATVPINATLSVTGPTGVTIDPGLLSATSSASSVTGSSTSSSATPTTFDTSTKSSETSAIGLEPTIPVHHRKPYKGGWRYPAVSSLAIHRFV